MWEPSIRSIEYMMCGNAGVMVLMIGIWIFQGIIESIEARFSNIVSTLWGARYRQHDDIKEKTREAIDKAVQWRSAELMRVATEVYRKNKEAEDTWRFSRYW